MGLSSAVQRWDDWQLRILSLASLGIQYLLWIFSLRRKSSIPPWYRLFIWLSFLGSDALAIYALAALFNRQKLHQEAHRCSSTTRANHDLEVFWAPVLLMHLGGPMFITAYNIEDNELWRRHIVTALSQVTVAVYVFCNSWPSSADKRLLAAAILLFIPGILKCMEKPWDLKRASFNSLATSSDPAQRTTIANREEELEDYVAEARAFIQCNDPPPELDDETKRYNLGRLRGLDMLFLDFASSYSVRRTNLESFWVLDDMTAYKSLKHVLSFNFDLLYTKVKLGQLGIGLGIWIFSIFFPTAAIVLFHISHKRAYSGSDVIVTLVLLYGTLVLEVISFFVMNMFVSSEWPDIVAQHSIIGFFARNKKHTRLVSIARSLRCQDLLEQYWCMEPCNSAPRITKLVRGYVRKGWKEHIRDAESFRKFNDIRGHGTLEREGCDQSLGWSIERPFDESILLWHLATDFCVASHAAYYSRSGTEISNYMMHLLFANPEMLMPGTRKNLHTAAYEELERILQVQGREKLPLDTQELTQKIVDKVKATHGCAKDGFIYDAWKLAQGLMALGDEKMWGVIQGVWVEMLCFSASRCRGYLHARILGSGVEYLSYVWLLWAHAGMETFTDKLQWTRLSKERMQVQVRGENAAGQSTSRCEGAATPALDDIVVVEMEYDTNPYPISN